ncbi:hypothetical protein NE237_006688 [Protea cynaroides]|uniref:Uncharacterized protein n=1 Tax=Protea cynaroides TaxID=273540 RepID=A0A9Q0QVR9_9MAGN|nr:hypothetical protein NE237_006688 [Protea cynaroides]
MEYGGPPVSYNLLRAASIDIKRIPTTAVVAPASLSDRVSLPVVQPLLSSDPLKKKLSEDLTRGSEADVSPGSCNGSLRNRGDTKELLSEFGQFGLSISTSAPNLRDYRSDQVNEELQVVEDQKLKVESQIADSDQMVAELFEKKVLSAAQ